MNWLTSSILGLRNFLKFLNLVEQWQKWQTYKRAIQAGIDEEKAKTSDATDRLLLDVLRIDEQSIDTSEEAIMNDPNRKELP